MAALAALAAMAAPLSAGPPVMKVPDTAITSLDSDREGKGWCATDARIDPVEYAREFARRGAAGGAACESPWIEVRVPSNLVGTLVMKAGGGRGEAWYRKVFVYRGDPGAALALRLGEIQDRDRVYLNGTLIGSTGAWNAALPQAYDKRRVYPVPAGLLKKDGPNLLLVHTKGYFPQISGIAKDSTAIGPVTQIMNAQFRETLVSMVFLACYCTVGLYFLFLFMRRRKGKENLFFALFVFGLVLYELLRSQLRYDTGFPFHVMKKIEYMQLFALMPLFHFFIRNFYSLPDRPWVKWFDRVMLAPLAVAAAAVIGVLATDSALIWDRINVLFVFKSWVLYVAGYLTIVIYHATKKNTEAVFMLCGLLCIFAAMVHDLAIHYTLINTPRAMGFVFFVFILSLAVILANRYVQVHNESERLNEELAGKNEELSRLDVLKDEFLANTSHELRTPLHGIIGIAESMYGEDGETDPDPDERRRNISMIVQSARRLSSLVNDLLDFSKMKHSGIELAVKAVDLRMMAGVVITMMRSLAGRGEIACVNRIAEDIPPVAADENRVEQILINLVGNAVKFTESGEIALAARVEGDMVAVSVSDTGIGIPADRLERIFESFVQADGSVSRRYGGTGLGLTISRNLAEAHGGTVTVESVPGRGSTFTFTLPVYRGDAPAPSAGGARERAALADAAAEDTVLPALRESAENGSAVLLVDDDPVNLRVLRNYLAPGKYRLHTAAGGREALELADAIDDLDLVLLDVMMPGMSGYEVCQRLRERRSLHDLPVLMLTARTRVLDIVAGFDAGANDYLAKPFDRRELIARVDTLLALKKAVRDHDTLRAMEKELDIARRIQQSILPDSPPALPWMDMYVWYTPMHRVGGDFYDFHIVDGNRLGVLMSDISGHGMPAALIAAMVKIAFSMQHSLAADPPAILGEMNRTLMGKCENRFITAAYVYLDAEARTLLCAGAGHTPVLVHRRKTGELLRIVPKGRVLGVWKDTTFEAESLHIEEGDRVILYTDGITECGNRERELFGEERFYELVQSGGDLSKPALVDLVVGRISQWSGGTEFDDDLTMIVIDL